MMMLTSFTLASIIACISVSSQNHENYKLTASGIVQHKILMLFYLYNNVILASTFVSSQFIRKHWILTHLAMDNTCSTVGKYCLDTFLCIATVLNGAIGAQKQTCILGCYFDNIWPRGKGFCRVLQYCPQIAPIREGTI